MLPNKLKLSVTNSDLQNAICGSPTRCAIANAVRRHIPTLTFVKVNPNKITITQGNLIHHYAMPDAAVKIVQANDNGTLSLGRVRQLTFPIMGKPAPIDPNTGTPERRMKINAARQARIEAGKPDKKYASGIREGWAKAAGKAHKRLVSAAQ